MVPLPGPAQPLTREHRGQRCSTRAGFRPVRSMPWTGHSRIPGLVISPWRPPWRAVASERAIRLSGELLTGRTPVGQCDGKAVRGLVPRREGAGW